MSLTNTQIATKSLIFAVGSYFGWRIFQGINDLLPQLDSLSPIMNIVVGLAGLWVLVKFGVREQ